MDIIAEIGWNFMGDLNLADQMIKSAARSGATHAKFQYWNPRTLKPGAWDTDGRREIYVKSALNEEKIGALIEKCGSYSVKFLVSCFNDADAKFLASLGIKNIKIPSHEVANVALHRAAANLFDKIYVSLGAGVENEIEDATAIYNQSGKEWVGMHCVSAYPCPVDQANLPRLKWLNDMCPEIGLSDHTQSILTPALSLAYGVATIEKHFTTDKNLPGRDNKFALDELEFTAMVENINEARALNLFRGTGPLSIELDTITHYRGRWG